MALPLASVVDSPTIATALEPGDPDPSIDVSVDITTPLDGDTIDPGALIEGTSSAGVVAGGERGLIVVIDLSGSAGFGAGVTAPETASTTRSSRASKPRPSRCSNVRPRPISCRRSASSDSPGVVAPAT